MRRLHTAALAAFLLCTCVGAARAYHAFDGCPAFINAAGIDASFVSRTFTSSVDAYCFGSGGTGCTWTDDFTVLQSRGAVGGWATVSHAGGPHSAACDAGAVTHRTLGPFTAGQIYKAILSVKNGSGIEIYHTEDTVQF